MIRSRQLAWFGLLVVLTFAVALFALFPRQPHYEGKPLSGWLADLSSQDEETRALAEESIREIGAPAVPHLLKPLHWLSSPFKRKLWIFHERFVVWVRHYTPLKLEMPKIDEHISAAFRALTIVGHFAEPALSEVARILPSQTFIAASIIAEIGAPVRNHPIAKQAIPHLIPELSSRDPDTRDAVTRALAAIGPDALVPVIHAMTNANETTRRHAVVALGKINERADLSIPALIRALGDDSAAVREPAAYGLSIFGNTAKTAAPVLVRLLDDPEPRVRLAASASLKRVDPEDTNAVPALIRKLQDPNLRAEAAAFLGGLGGAGKEVLPALLQALRGSLAKADAALARSGAMATSRKVDGEGEPEGLAWGDGYFRCNLAFALAKFGPEAVEAVPLLTRCLQDPQKMSRSAAVGALEKIGPQAREAVPHLLQALSDSEQDFGANLAAALAAIAPQSVKVAAALLKMLDDSNHEVRRAAAQALSRIDVDREATVQVLIRSLEDKSREVRKAAAVALSEFGEYANAAIPSLTKAAQDKFPSVRKAASEALQRLKK